MPVGRASAVRRARSTLASRRSRAVSGAVVAVDGWTSARRGLRRGWPPGQSRVGSSLGASRPGGGRCSAAQRATSARVAVVTSTERAGPSRRPSDTTWVPREAPRWPVSRSWARCRPRSAVPTRRSLVAGGRGGTPARAGRRRRSRARGGRITEVTRSRSLTARTASLWPGSPAVVAAGPTARPARWPGACPGGHWFHHQQPRRASWAHSRSSWRDR